LHHAVDEAQSGKWKRRANIVPHGPDPCGPGSPPVAVRHARACRPIAADDPRGSIWGQRRKRQQPLTASRMATTVASARARSDVHGGGCELQTSYPYALPLAGEFKRRQRMYTSLVVNSNPFGEGWVLAPPPKKKKPPGGLFSLKLSVRARNGHYATPLTVGRLPSDPGEA